MRSAVVPIALVVGLTLSLPITRAAEPGVDFFEKKIRPVLAEHCFKRHSTEADKTKKLKAGLLLDSRDGVRKGGDTGPAIVAGKPGESLLIEALKYDGDTKMPPSGKLPDAVIADFEQWVKIARPIHELRAQHANKLA